MHLAHGLSFAEPSLGGNALGPWWALLIGMVFHWLQQPWRLVLLAFLKRSGFLAHHT